MYECTSEILLCLWISEAAFSDHCINFIKAFCKLGMGNIPEDDSVVLGYLSDQGCEWNCYPTYLSHWGRAWKHMVVVASGFLTPCYYSMSSHFTHSSSTLLAEVSHPLSILNSRPLIPVSTAPVPRSPFLLTPATLFTQKVGDPPLEGDLTEKDLFKCQWRKVQAW